MSKESFSATCPHCGKRMYHHAVYSNDDNNFEVTCWEDEGGCGGVFYLKAEFKTEIYYLDKNGCKTDKKETI